MENMDIVEKEKNLYLNGDFIKEDEKIKLKKDERRLSFYMLYWTIMLFIASLIAAIVTKEGLDTFSNLKLMLLSPSKLVTDYFDIGGLASTFLNAALCGLGCNAMIFLTKAKRSSTLLAGYFLVIAHCFYGLNFLNMWLPFFGIMLYGVVCKKRIGDILHLSMFATSLAPFISDFLFRYTIGSDYVFGSPRVTVLGIVISVLFSIAAGFAIPALLNGMTKMHRGYNLYKAGLAIGLFGYFAHALFYTTFGIETPDSVVRNNPAYLENINLFYAFVVVFFIMMFLSTMLIGLYLNKWSFSGYGALWRCDGWRDDFPVKFGMPLTLINIGIYGFSILAYYLIVILLTKGTGFSGPTTGAIIAAITFSGCGQTARNVWPIALGYVVFTLLYIGVCKIGGMDMIHSLSAQGYMSAFAFATGLCPFAGRYGRRYGAIAGILDAIICTSTINLHGGFVLYNGGFTAGLTALLLIPILDFYNVKPKDLID